ncbi:MAG: hydrogen peroxide-inducible genes activator [Phocaeicola sp.]
MTLQQFEYIVAVDHFRHFAKAAEHCRVTQPTLSAMILKLEEELEVILFDRKQQPISPTPIGMQVIKQAKNILSQVTQIPHIIQEEQEKVSGIFKLAILPTIAPYLLPRFVPQLMKKYPDIDLRIIEMRTSEIKHNLLNGEIDAAILANMADLESFNQSPLFYESFFAYIAKGEKLFEHEVIRTTDLSGEQLFLLDEGHCFRDQLVRFCQLKTAQASQLAYSLGSMETFMRMVEGGKGITFIPELAIEQLAASQKELVRPFAIPTPARQIVMLTHPHFIRHRIKEKVTEEIRGAVPKKMLTPKPSQLII